MFLIYRSFLLGNIFHVTSSYVISLVFSFFRTDSKAPPLNADFKDMCCSSLFYTICKLQHNFFNCCFLIIDICTILHMSESCCTLHNLNFFLIAILSHKTNRKEEQGLFHGKGFSRRMWASRQSEHVTSTLFKLIPERRQAFDACLPKDNNHLFILASTQWK